MATTNITVRIEDSLLDQVDEYCKNEWKLQEVT